LSLFASRTALPKSAHRPQNLLPVEITLIPFAQARDLFGFSSRAVPCAPEDTPRQIALRLQPGIALDHFRAALDLEYVAWDTPIGGARELAIIPPVSGG
jgi:sulfur-carrier protein